MTLMAVCPCCEDGMVFKSRYGGNDPDTWGPFECDECGGEGEIPMLCEGYHNHDEAAIEVIKYYDLAMPACAVHAAEWKAEMEATP
jgi:hypothetical protein